MSAAAAEPMPSDGVAPTKKGKKKLVVMIVVVAVLFALLAGGAIVVKKRREAAAAALAAADGDAPAVAHEPAKAHHSGPPAFLPLDAFVVNLADRDTERFAQVGITLELQDPKYGEELKAYMPAIRNGILLVLSSKTSQQLLERAGKEQLAREVMREAVRPLGIALVDDGSRQDGGTTSDGLVRTPMSDSPVQHVHFSSFIIQ